jgi:hypothetical protein
MRSVRPEGNHVDSKTVARKRKCWLWNRGGDVDKILYHVEAEVIAL